jgi:hypothetical protein
MKCLDACELIPLYVGDDLGSDAIANELAIALEAHLDSCKICEAEYVSYADARQALLEAKGFDGAALDSLWHEIESQLPNKWHAFTRLKQIVALAAASLAVVFFATQRSTLEVATPTIPNLASNLQDIVQPQVYESSQFSRPMKPQEVNAFFAEQRLLNLSQFPEYNIVPEDLEGRLPAASLVGFDYSAGSSL